MPTRKEDNLDDSNHREDDDRRRRLWMIWNGNRRRRDDNVCLYHPTLLSIDHVLRTEIVLASRTRVLASRIRVLVSRNRVLANVLWNRSLEVGRKVYRKGDRGALTAEDGQTVVRLDQLAGMVVVGWVVVVVMIARRGDQRDRL